jgi:transketolase
MGLEDLAMMRAVHGSTVLYPCCANQTAKLVAAMADANQKGIAYLRTTRAKTPVLYGRSESFAPGGSKILRQSRADVVTVIAAGITVHEALKAHEELAVGGIALRVIDAYSVKPIDAETIRASVRATGGNVVVVEDHWAEGGLGDAVLACLAVEPPISAHMTHLAVRAMPCSGPPADLLMAAGIDAEAIARAALRLLSAIPFDVRAGERRCYLCGDPATWRIMLAGEDEPITEEDACEAHARGHVHRVRLVAEAPGPAAPHA